MHIIHEAVNANVDCVLDFYRGEGQPTLCSGARLNKQALTRIAFSQKTRNSYTTKHIMERRKHTHTHIYLYIYT